MPFEHIGQRIRRLRREQKKTLLEVASQANLTVGFLSQVERNLTGISLSSLVNIAAVLGVPLRQLVEQPLQTEPDSHQSERQSYSPPNSPQRYERLSSRFPGSVINAVKLTMPVGYHSESVSHHGDEFIYVLCGTVCYTVGEHSYRLAGGDSLHFDASQRHSLANVGEQEAQVISIGTLALFDDAPAGPAG